MQTKDWTPGSLLELSGYYWKTCALHAGIKLEVFTVIGGEMIGPEEAAERIGADRDGTERLLNALCAMGLLSKKDGLFSNIPSGMKYLVKDSPEYVGWMVMHHHHLVEGWSRLDRAVLSGSPAGPPSTVPRQEWRESFLKGMHTNASLQAPETAEALDLSGSRSLLDLGGGPGTYAIHFCRANPGLSAVVFDLPDSGQIALDNIEAAGLSDRISFYAGDFHEDPIPSGFDAVWLSHILHAEGPEDCRKILSRAASALNPGGRILVQDFILNDTLDGPEFPALFSLNMLAVTEKGRAYSESQIREMLAAAGAGDTRRESISSPTGAGVVSAGF